MMRRGPVCLASAVAMLVAISAVPVRAAVVLGQVDDFQDGTTNGWASGSASPNPPVNQPSGGPSGIGDRYLLVSSTGGIDPGGKLSAISGPQWAGNYISAGVTSISMDVNNLGATDLSLRLLFEGGSTSTAAFSDQPIVVLAGSGWTRVAFSILPGALLGSGFAALSSATQIRLYHSVADDFPHNVPPGGGGIPPIVATLGVDNVTAVPEPGSWSMLGAGLAVLIAATSMRRRRSR